VIFVRGGKGEGVSVLQSVRTFYYSAIYRTQIADSIRSVYHVTFCVKDEIMCSYCSFYSVLKLSELDSEPGVFYVTIASIYCGFVLYG
jgi:hypothetical protein